MRLFGSDPSYEGGGLNASDPLPFTLHPLLKPYLFLQILLLAFFLTGCAHHQLPPYEKPLRRAAIQKVRTTAYTSTECDHLRYGQCSALGTRLQCGVINSAAADWARWPAGTRFRIRATREIFIVDDYGWALAGTNTIDLYKPTRTAMREWGVRRVTIEILEWGNPWKSYARMVPVKSYRHIQRMLHEIEKFFSHHQPEQPVVTS
ncbi:MAG: hypothetical protein A3F67_03430 [Verrucomicrobia bacterium RIFCSPHIGHO2_12_FULL_41_10]|nr:MAG: hypothetical protein A3F67_03430 [Verrucomicrobia bacterium RIFCSPHIGHO2_12_FULL_41_10]HLB34861.1 hypothetical protein [Chthoniobacterales bacterium]